MSSYHLNKTQLDQLTDFINAFNTLLREHEMLIEFTDGALFSENAGYLGQLEDNNDHLVLSDGEQDIVASKRN